MINQQRSTPTPSLNTPPLSREQIKSELMAMAALGDYEADVFDTAFAADKFLTAVGNTLISQPTMTVLWAALRDRGANARYVLQDALAAAGSRPSTQGSTALLIRFWPPCRTCNTIHSHTKIPYTSDL